MSSMILPEGLLLTSVNDDTLIIHDAQDWVWVEFKSGAGGDPVSWERNIVRKTCHALGVTEAFNNDIDDVQDLDTFLVSYFGEDMDPFRIFLDDEDGCYYLIDDQTGDNHGPFADDIEAVRYATEQNRRAK